MAPESFSGSNWPVSAALAKSWPPKSGLFSAFAGLFIGLASAVALQTGALPRWLGWLGIAVLVLSVICLALPELGFLAFPLDLV